MGKVGDTQRELTERQSAVLAAKFEVFLRSGAPVSSGQVATQTALGLSPASLRTTMSQLSEMGLLVRAHGYAGSVPSSVGIAAYAAALARSGARDAGVEARIDALLESESGVADATGLLGAVSRVLAVVTHNTGIVRMPDLERSRFDHVAIALLSERRVLAIFVTSGGAAMQRTVEVEFAMTASEAEQMSNYLTSKLTGRTLRDVVASLTAEVLTEEREQAVLAKRALSVARGALAHEADGMAAAADVLMQGVTNTLSQPEFADAQAARGLLDVIERKRKLLAILDRAMRDPVISVEVGDGTALPDGLSLVAAPYGFGASGGSVALGAVAVLGSRRMNYGKVIPIVRRASERVSEELRDGPPSRERVGRVNSDER